MDDSSFLAAIAADPSNNELRLVYADWLEEQGDRRAEYLRMEVEFDQRIGRTPAARRLRNRLFTLRFAMEPGWLAQIDRCVIDCCEEKYADVCPRGWHMLTPTTNPDIRQCAVCNQSVIFCEAASEVFGHERDRYCRPLTFEVVAPEKRNPNEQAFVEWAVEIPARYVDRLIGDD